MLLASLSLSILLPVILAVASPVHKTLRPRACSNPAVRKEWRTLSASEKHSYIDAVHCLTNKTAISGIEGTINRFDDFHAVHNNQTPNIHFVGHFILWHRYFVAAYEQALREECGYTGGQPYWDWSLDASPNDENSTAIFDSPVFDPVTGFGGNGPYVEANATVNVFNLTGRLGGGCVSDGPFVYPNFVVNFPEPHCLTRDFIPWIMNTWVTQNLVDDVQEQPDYTTWAKAIEGIPSFSEPNVHGGGHFGIGGVLGQMGDAYNSPGDPIFYLHHGNLDRIFTEWQSFDLSARLSEVGGPILPFDYGGQNVTLDFEINLGNLAGNITLQQALPVQGSVFCYQYDTLVNR